MQQYGAESAAARMQKCRTLRAEHTVNAQMSTPYDQWGYRYRYVNRYDLHAVIGHISRIEDAAQRWPQRRLQNRIQRRIQQSQYYCINPASKVKAKI